MEWRNDKAIYLQVVEWFKHNVILGMYAPGDKIPSVRELALKLEINPNTVVKVYDILNSEGLIEAKRTNGYFLTDDLEILERLKPFFAKEYIVQYLNNMKQIGYTKEQAINLLKESKD